MAAFTRLAHFLIRKNDKIESDTRSGDKIKPSKIQHFDCSQKYRAILLRIRRYNKKISSSISKLTKNNKSLLISINDIIQKSCKNFDSLDSQWTERSNDSLTLKWIEKDLKFDLIISIISFVSKYWVFQIIYLSRM